MSAPKPILGYPSKTAAILALRAQNMQTAEIADMLGMKSNAVAAIESSARNNAALRSLGGKVRAIALSSEEIDKLIIHAFAWKVRPSHLATQIVAAVLSKGMVDAVLEGRRVR